MKKIYYLTLVFFVSFHLVSTGAEQTTDEKYTINDVKAALQLSGQHRFVYRMFFKLYDATLYTEVAVEKNMNELLSGDHALHLEFDYLRKIKKSIILESSKEILANNMSAEELNSIQERVDLINEAYRTVYNGDRSALTYLPGKGTTLWINEEPIINIKGADFARLYFRIWLGNRPISKSMRDALIGQL